MLIRNTLAAAALAFVSATAMASATWSVSSNESSAHFSGTESAVFGFSLTTATDASSFVLNGTDLFSVRLVGGSLSSPVSFSESTLNGYTKFSYSGALGVGDYKLYVTEAGSTSAFNTYNGAFYFNPAALDTTSLTTAPVPEPESYAMLLAGLGAIGFMARRRKNK